MYQHTNGVQVRKEDAVIQSKNGTQRHIQTTKRWYFLVYLKDVTDSWCAMKTLKESSPIEFAGYSASLGIRDEPYLAWWVPYMLGKREKVIAGVKYRTKNNNNQCDICVPRYV